MTFTATDANYLPPFNRPPIQPECSHMNLLTPFEDPWRSAEVIDNRRISKLALEALQMACQHLRENCSHIEGLYKATHVNHPVTRWVCKSEANYIWTLQHTIGLLDECKDAGFYFQKKQKMLNKLRELNYTDYAAKNRRHVTPFQNSARHIELGLDFTHLEVHEAYQKYMVRRWQIDLRHGFKPDWRGHKIPEFIANIDNDFYQWLYRERFEPLRKYSPNTHQTQRIKLQLGIKK